MTAQIIDGKLIAQQVREEVASEGSRAYGSRQAETYPGNRVGW